MHSNNSEIVCFGEVLWDNLPHGCFPGGALMNVAIHLFHLGVPSAIISKVGKDQLGDDIVEFIGKNGVQISEIQVSEGKETGIVMADVSDPLNVKYDIKYPVAWDNIGYKDASADLIKKSKMLVYGSLSVRDEFSEMSLYKYLESSPYSVFDVNLRAPHFSQDRIKKLFSLADFVKMNEEELDLISKWYDHSGSREENVRTLAQELSIETICVTLGGDGAMMFDAGKMYKHDGYTVDVVDTIGSGDSFLAALLSQRLNDTNPQNSLAFACAVGAYVASQSGATPKLDMEIINTMIS